LTRQRCPFLPAGAPPLRPHRRPPILLVPLQIEFPPALPLSYS
jgi:hypothetical protein